MTQRRDGSSGTVHLPARRQFLRRVGVTGALAFGAPLFGDWLGGAHGATTDAYASGLFALEIEGVFAGMLSGFRGGNVVAEVTPEPPGSDLIQRKHLCCPRIEPITIEVSPPLPQHVGEWIKSSIEPQPSFLRKSGAIVEFNPTTLSQIRRYDFSDAWISEVEFPACESAALQRRTGIAISFVPAAVGRSSGQGSLNAKSMSRSSLSGSAFRLRIQGLEQATTRALDVAPIGVKIGSAPDPGAVRDYAGAQRQIAISNVAVTVPDANAGQAYDWYEDFVIRGNNDQSRERVGVLEYFAGDLRTVLLTLNLFNLGVFRLAPAPAAADASSRTSAISRIEMYCESLRVDFGA